MYKIHRKTPDSVEDRYVSALCIEIKQDGVFSRSNHLANYISPTTCDGSSTGLLCRAAVVSDISDTP